MLSLLWCLACTASLDTGAAGSDGGSDDGGSDDGGSDGGGDYEGSGIQDIDVSLLPAAASPCREPVLVTVTEIVDGDTVWVRINGADSEKVRFIGVDTPEIEHDDDPADCYGDEASDFTESAILQEHVWLSFDEECLDYYDRTLAYISTGVGSQDFFQRILLQSGYAEPLAVEPNTSYKDTFEEDAAEAEDGERGLWGECR